MRDPTFSLAKFGHEGLPFRLPVLQAKEKHVHRVTVTPTQLGQFNDLPARVKYQRLSADGFKPAVRLCGSLTVRRK